MSAICCQGSFDTCTQQCYSLLEQLREEDKAEQDQKHEQDTARELINEAATKMAAAIELKNMQSVKVAQMMLKAGNEKLQETSKKLDFISTKQQDLRKRLRGCESDKKDQPQAKKKA